MDQSIEVEILNFINERGIIRPQDFVSERWTRTHLQRLVEKGRIKKLGRGLYSSIDSVMTENHSLAEVSKLAPNSVICLITALQFYNLTTQIPRQVWIAIDLKAARPRFAYPPIKIVNMTGESLTAGINQSEIEGVPVKIFSPGKTVADCFKFRNRVGLDVAIEALRNSIKTKQTTYDEIWEYAGVCRVRQVMQPYMEALA